MVVPSNNRQSEHGQSEYPQPPSALPNGQAIDRAIDQSINDQSIDDRSVDQTYDQAIRQEQTVQNLAEDVAALREQAETAKKFEAAS